MTEAFFGRVITAMVTPFNEKGEVDYAIAEKLACHLVAHGSDGLVICGTTGESPTLTWDEELELFQVIKKAVPPEVKIIAGTGSNSTTEAINATKKAAQLGLDGSLQVVPYYNKPPQDGLYDHYRAIAEAAPDLPMMLYNVPGRTSCNLEAATVTRLAKIDNIVAIKEASGNLEQACAIRNATPPEFGIYSGDDFLTLPMLTVGGCGVVSVASHVVGPEMKAMILHFEQGNTAAAVATQTRLAPLYQALFSTTNPIPVKTALALQGWPVGSLRSPLCDMEPHLKAKLAAVMTELGLLNP